MTFHLKSKAKNLAILIIVNIGIIFATYSVYSDNSNSVSLLYLKQKINVEEVTSNKLKKHLVTLKGLLKLLISLI
ncbi:hypothetical protein BAZSYMB_SCAFFOLD00026_11 [Bathymodiolus azoricus thioautotrophic gill symbiont]|uniref:Uncharacterized protein n=1 Tax=Bathymodiolus azoricus thioautotrophic gill symbiont TaxID=235205 RepID=A0A1H6JDT9_9GAMM|nr:hypothetical protein BAZSYMB_SCAFFOLD00026_11 [Bathymodiolus azoricus thioautotrophic gill symbiont]